MALSMIISGARKTIPTLSCIFRAYPLGKSFHGILAAISRGKLGRHSPRPGTRWY
jgi:hypothetical protein